MKTTKSDKKVPATDKPCRKVYEKPSIIDAFQLEALAVSCTDTNAKQDVALGCNPGALFS